MNVADSDMLVGLLGRTGWGRARSADDADVVLINTCAVREKAEDRVLARAAELAALQRRRPELVIGIAGCMAEHLKESLVERAPWVDVVAGPDSYRRMPELLAAARAARLSPDAATPFHAVDVRLDKAETYEGLSGADGGDGVSGFVTIQRGCDKFCTFCVVPFTRGRERGTPPREVLRQVRELADRGYKEVVLLGQTVNSYRWEDATFAELLRAVARVDGIERVRFTSPYPVDFTDDVVAAIAEEPKVCKYVHLPVQSGSDDVLTRMRRGYTVADYRAIVARLRAAAPTIALSTDILSGFSGETEADHRATLALMDEVRFDSAFMFTYSERDLTFAARKLPDDVPAADKRRRLAEIIALQERISAEAFAAQVGRRERVLVVGPSRRSAAQMMGRTDGFKTVILPADLPAALARPGALVDVEIERATMATLFGRLG
ncbi:MAG: tRNA (N6-isopentenyl adenosine(37)-C2)-methylthiotransferase MiaB [Kofleriaceae bacterium]|nr:tRNA (N6-isopentenyl adenosine(37)-C2)-methylthiotransferase MiaB [Myxococcales bacterium]MCB9563304.1 tRNA (N6-isopentenyl adenosine(37)-C2)-methylthiotransferase MiaB [Kofleriaceae bacterium]MCB9572230.1 tRNA (N6-isopentenyl adenosine(37)-C2)-methylthiotransferase MiaB [Kofleriaceae bacterium]